MSQDLERMDSLDVKSYVHAVEAICGYIRGQLEQIPTVGLVIGSELQDVAHHWFPHVSDITPPALVEYPELTAGNLPFATIRKVGDQGVLCFESGVYGKQTMSQLALPVRVAGVLGVKKLIVITSGCSLEAGIDPGDVCILADHINLLGNSPLVGENIEAWGPRFPDMTEPYDVDFRRHCQNVARTAGLNIRERILSAIPTLEQGRIKKDGFDYLRRLGADLVGFGGVPEVITARHMDIRVLGIVCVSGHCVEEGQIKQSGKGTADSDESRPIVHALVNAIASLT